MTEKQPEEVAAAMIGKSPEMEAIEKRTRDAVEAYAEAWRRGNRNALLNLFAEDGTWIDPVGTPPWRGRMAIGEFWDMAHSTGATLVPVVQRIIVCGNEAILLFRIDARKPGGGGMGLDACNQMIVNDQGKIQSGKAYWDKSCIVELP